MIVMAVTYIADKRVYVGLSTDTKPTDARQGDYFEETNTLY